MGALPNAAVLVTGGDVVGGVRGQGGVGGRVGRRGLIGERRAAKQQGEEAESFHN